MCFQIVNVKYNPLIYFPHSYRNVDKNDMRSHLQEIID